MAPAAAAAHFGRDALRLIVAPFKYDKECMVKRIATALILMSGSGVALADGWSGELTAGLIMTSGNSETTTSNGKLTLGYVTGPWEHSSYLSFTQARDEEQTTAERYTAGYKVDFSFTDTDYVYFSADWQKDLFASVTERTVETVGYGRRIFNTDAHQLDLEAGAGARQNEFAEPPGSSSDELVGTVGLDYAWTISPTSKFTQTLLAEYGDSNTYTESVSQLKLSIVGNLFAALAFTARHNSVVSEGNEKTDTETSINLSYEFGKANS